VARDCLFPLALARVLRVAFSAPRRSRWRPSFTIIPGNLPALARCHARAGPGPVGLAIGLVGRAFRAYSSSARRRYAGALLHLASFHDALGAGAYHALVWIAYWRRADRVPGARRELHRKRPGARLPGAFLALNGAGGAASGVEGGVQHRQWWG